LQCLSSPFRLRDQVRLDDKNDLAKFSPFVYLFIYLFVLLYKKNGDQVILQLDYSFFFIMSN
jgi:hypothetical protein